MELPASGLTVVTGASGSGKSSLVFDTLFGESRARMTEHLSGFVQRQLGAGEARGRTLREARGLRPAIALRQRAEADSAADRRATVATAAALHPLLRTMWSRAASEGLPAAAFSFFRKEGACEECGGLGVVRRCVASAVVEDVGAPLFDGALRVSNKVVRDFGRPDDPRPRGDRGGRARARRRPHASLGGALRGRSRRGAARLRRRGLRRGLGLRGRRRRRAPLADDVARDHGVHRSGVRAARGQRRQVPARCAYEALLGDPALPSLQRRPPEGASARRVARRRDAPGALPAVGGRVPRMARNMRKLGRGRKGVDARGARRRAASRHAAAAARPRARGARPAPQHALCRRAPAGAAGAAARGAVDRLRLRAG